MSISNYGELKTAVANWMLRSDLTSRIPEFITLAETAFYYGLQDQTGRWLIEPLRIRAMETASDVTINAQSVALPAGYLQARRFYIAQAGDNRQLDFIPPVDFWGRGISSETATPVAFTVEGDNFKFAPSPDASYTGKFLYYKKFDTLSDDSDTNWLLTNAPNVYLYGALFQSFGYERNPIATEYLNQFAAHVGALNGANASDRHSGAPLQMRVGATP